MAGRYERKKPKKKGWKIALIVIAVIAVLLAAVAIAGYLYYDSLLGKINKAEIIEKDPSQDLLNEIGPIIEDTETFVMPTEETTEATTEETTIPPMRPEDIINVLVVGQSARPGEEARMADSTMLITINKYTKTVHLNSVLRDAFVIYPKYRGGQGGKCKLASAYATAYAKWDIGGAMEVMNLLMEQNFGVGVDYNFEVDFEMFMGFINALGGVSLELTQAEADYMNKELKGYAEYTEGKQYLDGYPALVYARMRKAEGDNESDIVRSGRQQYLVERIIHAMVKKLSKEGLSGIQELADASLPYLTTNMEKSEINKLILDLVPILPELTIEKGTLPVKGTYKGELYDIYGQGRLDSILRFDPGQNAKIMKPITEGIFE